MGWTDILCTPVKFATGHTPVLVAWLENPRKHRRRRRPWIVLAPAFG